MEMIFRNIPLARSGHSDKRGDLNVGTLCMIPARSYSKLATVHYKNIPIGVVKNLTFVDLHNGVAELRGDIVLNCSYSTIAEMAFDEVYPSISVSTFPNTKAVPIPVCTPCHWSSEKNGSLKTSNHSTCQICAT